MKKGQNRREFFVSAGLGAAAVAGASGAAVAAEKVRVRGRLGKKKKFKFGLASYSLRKFSLEDALKMSQQVGLEHIALKSFHLPMESSESEIDAVAAKVKAAGIRLYGGGVIKMKSTAEVENAFKYAKRAGMKTIIGVPGYEQLELVNQKIKEYNIQVAIHNHGPGDKLYPTPGSAYEKIKHLDKRFGLCIDIGHTQRVGVDPSEAAQEFADRLLDIHMKDVSKAAPDGKTVEVGRGVIDIVRFMRVLLRTEYSGVVSFEYEKDANDPLAGLAESVGYVKGVLAAV
ncbi:MAG: sugar phosphate isomerase/epimerase [Planctomycetes bacterium]|nr:sugar phosphate isomerase/epimerase [Planctomycetota bacterium]